MCDNRGILCKEKVDVITATRTIKRGWDTMDHDGVCFVRDVELIGNEGKPFVRSLKQMDMLSLSEHREPYISTPMYTYCSNPGNISIKSAILICLIYHKKGFRVN
jgi:hypothetical protein